jgi:hypothetical protein
MSSINAALLSLSAAAAALLGCVVKDPSPITERFVDEFARADVGRNYKPTSEAYELRDGVLAVKGAYNHPLWLRKRLPDEVSLELDVWAESRDGDLKVEVYGDGESHAENRGAYTASGYVVCMGGWNNSKSFIARKDEHGNDMVSRTQPAVELGRRYHWKLVRRGARLEWYVDDMQTPFLAYDDPAPLVGAENGYFGFNNWQSDARFDDLVIEPL